MWLALALNIFKVYLTFSHSYLNFLNKTSGQTLSKNSTASNIKTEGVHFYYCLGATASLIG